MQLEVNQTLKIASNTELSFSDSETDNTTEPEVSDDSSSMCELDGISSLFDEQGMFESVGEDDECCYQHASDERKSVDNEDALMRSSIMTSCKVV